MAKVPKTCQICQQLISGSWMEYEGEFFHPDCLTCDSCHQRLTGLIFANDDGRGRLCENCVPRKICGVCEKQIDGAWNECKGVFFHAECFKCGGCKGPLSKVVWDAQRRTLSCPQCANARTCKRCSKIISGTATVVGDSFYHAECFQCDVCCKQLSQYFAGSPAGLFCSMACKSQRTCARCHQQFTQGWREFGGNRFHTDCLACDVCKATLDDNIVVAGDGKKYLCSSCAKSPPPPVAEIAALSSQSTRASVPTVTPGQAASAASSIKDSPACTAAPIPSTSASSASGPGASASSAPEPRSSATPSGASTSQVETTASAKAPTDHTVQLTMSEAMREVSKADGVVDWAVMRGTAVLELYKAGTCGVEAMKRYLDEDEVLFCILRLEFNGSWKFIFVHWVGSKTHMEELVRMHAKKDEVEEWIKALMPVHHSMTINSLDALSDDDIIDELILMGGAGEEAGAPVDWQVADARPR
mmetsp:Transcript_18998/g.44306  ORF Transcript_18998/g.44306 Transcript_18998/m.44306 type:complete len:473 (-) Transcript_18998:193-1611(-)